MQQMTTLAPPTIAPFPWCPRVCSSSCLSLVSLLRPNYTPVAVNCFYDRLWHPYIQIFFKLPPAVSNVVRRFLLLSDIDEETGVRFCLPVFCFIRLSVYMLVCFSVCVSLFLRLSVSLLISLFMWDAHHFIWRIYLLTITNSWWVLVIPLPTLLMCLNICNSNLVLKDASHNF